MRTKNSFTNLIVSCGTQLANVLLQFCLRTVFIQVLTTEYLGLNGLFSNILSYLSFAELGFGSAITFSLYKPLANKDEIAISGIMNYFQKVYCLVGTFVLVVGLALTPFIDYLINGVPDIPSLHLIYAMWVINSGISYFLVYKSTLIIADQRKDIVDKNNFLFKIIQLVGQVMILLLTHNYIFYLLIQIIITLVTNISISSIADKRYVFLKRNRNEKIKKDTLSQIKKNVNATIMHKLGAVIIFGTDNLLLSKYFGLIIVGLYSNYYLIISTLTNLVGQIQASVVASVGNLGATTTSEKKMEVFEKYFFLIFWIFSVTSTCLVSLLNPFIRLWIGQDYIISMGVVGILVFNYYLNGIRSAAAMFDNAFGLFWNTRYLPIIESVFNIVLSVLMAKFFGYSGIFLGTMVSSLITGVWFEPYILYKIGFEKSPCNYYKNFIEYLMITIFSGGLFIYIIHLITIDGIAGFIVKCIVVGIGSNLLLFLIYIKSRRMIYVYEMFVKIIIILKR